MSEQRFTTEEAERIVAELNQVGASELEEKSAVAIRSLAAERDRLGNEVEHHVEELDLRMKAIREQEKRMAALAAERDALREDLRWIESVAGEPSEPHYGQALSAVRDRAHFALGENQP